MPAKSSKHWAKNNEWRIKNKAMLAALGLCRCKNKVEPGKVSCRKCLDEAAERCRKIRAERKEQHKCVDCGKAIYLDAHKYTRCPSHRRRAAAHSRVFRGFRALEKALIEELAREAPMQA